MNKKEEKIEKKDKDEEFISIMTDPDLHPLPITPNDPLSIVSIKFISKVYFYSFKQIKLLRILQLQVYLLKNLIINK